MKSSLPNHYATLGLDHNCTDEQIRSAYRLLAKQVHPDLNRGANDAVARTQALNLAYEILGDPERRRAYDAEFQRAEKSTSTHRAKTPLNLSQDVLLRLEDFFRGATREIHINDPGNPNGREVYELVVPAQTAPGTRFRLRREGGGFVAIRVKPLPHFQFKVRGADLRCDLKINARRAEQGGEQFVKGILGATVRVKIPARVARGEIIRIQGEGLPKARGGRGDLLVRILYRPEIRIVRKAR